jgi:hypothetical protein
MLSKITGPVTTLTMSGSAQKVDPVTNETGNYQNLRDQQLPATKVRIATGAQPAYVAFGVTATTSTAVLMPANWVEHFKLSANTLTNYVSVLQAGTAGTISITPVA